jgi:hypothetical protein
MLFAYKINSLVLDIFQRYVSGGHDEISQPRRTNANPSLLGYYLFLFLLKRSTPFLSTFFERDLSLGLLALHPNTKKERERESKRAKRDKALGNNNE